MGTVYVETTVVGHLAGSVHPDPVIAARQAITRRWWPRAGIEHELFISDIVIDECSAGDPTAAQERLAEIASFPLLDLTDPVRDLANKLISSLAVPQTEPRDALHIALAAVHGVEYLVTWNFKHIANATLRVRIETVCRDAGYEPPIICTHEELAGNETNDAVAD